MEKSKENVMDIQEAIRQAAREKTQEMVCSGEIVLPSDYSEQAAQEAERLRSGKRKLKTLKRWRSAGKILYEQVLVFGDILLADEDGWSTIFERPTGKMIWGKYQYDGDIYGLYQFVIHLSLLTDWKQFPSLPQPEKLGIEWRVTELTWETGHSMFWELFARMNYDGARAAEALRSISRSPF
jgi:hypothetical protein